MRLQRAWRFRAQQRGAWRCAGRLSSLADRKSDGNPICSFEFSRDANGNPPVGGRFACGHSLREDGSCWYYGYDGLQRLTHAEWKASGGASLYAYEYNYDKVGNRTSLVANGTPTYTTYNAANELLQEVTPGVETAYPAFLTSSGRQGVVGHPAPALL